MAELSHQAQFSENDYYNSQYLSYFHFLYAKRVPAKGNKNQIEKKKINVFPIPFNPYLCTSFIQHASAKFVVLGNKELKE